MKQLKRVYIPKAGSDKMSPLGILALEDKIVQGGSLSPLLANIYLHYTLDLWFTKVLAKSSKGKSILQDMLMIVWHVFNTRKML